MLVLLISACNLPASRGPVGRKRNPERAMMSVAETVATLEDQELAETGVWSLLAQLGIGVYTGDGDQIMPGSETREHDFWLYDFEVEILANMALQRSEPFLTYYELLAGLGYEGSEEDLLGLYRRVYREHEDEVLVQLFTVMGLEFTSDTLLTPLQQWLLLLDTFVPPNGDQPMMTTLERSGGHLAKRAALEQLQGGSCGSINGGGIRPNWGIVTPEWDSHALEAAEDAYYAIHGHLITSAANLDINASRESGHEGHKGLGDRFEYSIRVNVDFIPELLIPEYKISCGYLVPTNYEYKFVMGPLADVPVDWQIPDVLTAHGPIEEIDPLTNENGEAKLVVQLQHEEAEGIGPYREEIGSLQASLDLGSGYRAAGISDPRLLDFVLAQEKVGPVPVIVSWHDPCESFTLIISEELHQQVPYLSNNITIGGPILVKIHPGTDPPSIDGSEQLPVSGSGQAGECLFTNTGVDHVTVAGTVSPGHDKEPPTLHMTINHDIQISMQGEQCRGGTQMPISLGEVTLDMPLVDGVQEGGSFSQPTVSGVTIYELEVYCGQ
jgi:hypothetical protein